MDSATIMQNFSSVTYEGENNVTLDQNQLHEKVYVPRKFSVKFIKICSFITGIVTALLLTTIIIISSAHRHKTADAHSDQLFRSAPKMPGGPTDLSGLLVVNVGSKSLWIMNPESKSTYNVGENSSSNIDIFDYDYRNKRIIWMEKNSTELKSLLQGNHPIEIFPRKVKAGTFRIDHITGNLYVIDNVAETVNVINMENGLFAVVTSQITNPHDLVLDPAEGIMFIASKHHSIARLDMNGDNLELVVNNSHVSALAIDCVLKNLYFAVDFTSIESVNYMGERRVTITKVFTAIGSLSALNQSLYWTGEAALWTCEIEETAYGPHCKNQSPAHVPVRDPRTVRSYEHHRRAEANPCNGECQHLCLLAPAKAAGRPSAATGRYSCACALGWQLEGDGKSCKLVVDYLLYALGSHARARRLDEPGRRSFVDVIYPTEFHVESLKLKRAIDFDYDMRADRMFFSDDYNIFVMSIKAGEFVEQRRLIRARSDYHSIKELAYDWLSGNLFYVKRSMSSANDHEIVAVHYTGKLLLEEITVHTFVYKSMIASNCPVSLIILPDAGSLYYTSFYAGTNEKDIKAFSIMRNVANELTHLPYVNYHRTLAIDYQQSMLYFLADRLASAISSMNYNASNEHSLFKAKVPNLISISVYRQWLYISNEMSIWRLDKTDGTGMVQVIEQSDTRILSAMRIVSPMIQAINADSPCAFNNGGCKQFCFASFAAKECRCTDQTKSISEFC